MCRRRDANSMIIVLLICIVINIDNFCNEESALWRRPRLGVMMRATVMAAACMLGMALDSIYGIMLPRHKINSESVSNVYDEIIASRAGIVPALSATVCQADAYKHVMKGGFRTL